MYITKKDVEKILEVMNKFPTETAYQLKSENTSGIGSIMTLSIQTTIEGIAGEFTVEISGVEDW
jgi:hypothetical protein